MLRLGLLLTIVLLILGTAPTVAQVPALGPSCDDALAVAQAQRENAETIAARLYGQLKKAQAELAALKAEKK